MNDRSEVEHSGFWALPLMSRSKNNDLHLMATRKRQSGRKYKNAPPQIKVNGERIELGGVDEMVCLCRWTFHRFLEELINKPDAPNPLDALGDGWPELRQALRRKGYAGLTRVQLLAKRDEYMTALRAGSEPYSDKLHGTFWLQALK